MQTIRIATRGSAQARTQAEAVGAAVEASNPGVTVEYVFIETQGDVNQATPLHQMGGQGIFVKEQRVFREGEHLVEIRSDATAEYLLRTDVLTDSELAAEQGD